MALGQLALTVIISVLKWLPYRMYIKIINPIATKNYSSQFAKGQSKILLFDILGK